VVALYRPLTIQAESGIASTSEQSKEPLRGAVPQLIDDHSDNDDTADDNVGVRVWDGQLAATTANGGDDELIVILTSVGGRDFADTRELPLEI